MLNKDTYNTISSNTSNDLIPLNKEAEALASRLFDYNDPENCKENILIYKGGSPVVARGELTVIAGQRKSFKSHVCASLAASAIGCEPQKCLNFEVSTPLKVMYIDTEQSLASSAELFKIITRYGDSSYFIPYNWRGSEPCTRSAALSIAIRDHRPDIVIVDGIVDLVKDYDINNILESSKLVADLLRIAQEYQCGIIAVIHLNPLNTKERGQLGTILCNKAYGYIGLTRQHEVVTVSSSDSARNKPISAFQIEFDEELGTIREVGESSHINSECTNKRKNKGYATKPLSDNSKAMIDTIRGLFNVEHPQYSYTEIVNILKRAFNIPEENSTLAKTAIKRAVDDKIIIKGEGQRGLYRLFDDLPE